MEALVLHLYQVHGKGFGVCKLVLIIYIFVNLFALQLKANFDCAQLGEFPGKSLLGLSLSEQQLEARKTQLEHYLHSCFQDRVIGCSDVLKEFFCAAQKVQFRFCN